jgi:hypothetical protein
LAVAYRIVAFSFVTVSDVASLVEPVKLPVAVKTALNCTAVPAAWRI